MKQLKIAKCYEPIIFNEVEFVQFSETSYSTIDGYIGIVVHDADDVEVSVYCGALRQYMRIGRPYNSLEAAMTDVALYVKTGLLNHVIGKGIE